MRYLRTECKNQQTDQKYFNNQYIAKAHPEVLSNEDINRSVQIVFTDEGSAELYIHIIVIILKMTSMGDNFNIKEHKKKTPI